MKIARLAVLIGTVCFAAVTAVCPASADTAESTVVSDTHVLTIDGKTTDKDSFWRGTGYDTSGGISGLLLDYKAESPEKYQDILRQMFSPEGAMRMQRLTVALGDDDASGSGLAAAKRSRDESADVTRGGLFSLAADAKQIYPQLLLCLAVTGDPPYISEADESERYELRYRYIAEALAAAYSTYGTEFDSVAAEAASGEADPKWTVYLRERLAKENSLGYDASGIRVLSTEEYRGREVYTIKHPLCVDYGGHEGALITAADPWSGYTSTETAMYLCEHISLFGENGWALVKSGCTSQAFDENIVFASDTDGTLTFCDTDTGDYSAVLVNTTSTEIIYYVNVSSLAKADAEVSVWETALSDDENGGISCMKNVMDIQPEKNGSLYTYQVNLKPYSVCTVTTLDIDPPVTDDDIGQTRLELPYTDNFEYKDMPEGYTASRGGAPRYFSAIKGIFEVSAESESNNTLHQISDKESAAVIGDDCWSNYTVSAEIKLAENDLSERNYAGVGLRTVVAHDGICGGYRLLLNAEGVWKLYEGSEMIAEGKTDEISLKDGHELSLTAEGVNIFAAIDGKRVASKKLGDCMYVSGRAAVFGGRSGVTFDDLNIVPADELTNYVTHIGNSDNALTFTGSWQRDPEDGMWFSGDALMLNTSTDRKKPSAFSFTFEGDSLALLGTADQLLLSVQIDGKNVDIKRTVTADKKASAVWSKYNLGYAEHKATVSVSSGKLRLYAIEYGSMTCLKNGDPSGGMLTEELNTGSYYGNTDWTGKMTRRKAAVCAGGAGAAVTALYILRRRKKRSS